MHFEVVRLPSTHRGHTPAPACCRAFYFAVASFSLAASRQKTTVPKETKQQAQKESAIPYLYTEHKHRPDEGRHQHSPLNSSSEVKPSFSQVLIAVTNCVMMVSTIERSSKPTCSPCNRRNQRQAIKVFNMPATAPTTTSSCALLLHLEHQTCGEHERCMSICVTH